MYKVCVVTGSRAEYGILKPLILKLHEDKEIEVSIIATAMHMEEKYGSTYKVIEQDGFSITKKIFLDLKDTSKQTIARSISTLQIALSDVFEETDYDLVIILGDRYEMLAVSNVSLIYNIPVCHLHGGEKTLGNFDEYIRHAITKMSHLHLVSTEEYRKRVIQLGESPSTVYNIGSLGVENVLSTPKFSKIELEKRLTISLPESYYVVLFHPVTLNDENDALIQVQALLGALSTNDSSFIFIGSNSDTGSDAIMSEIRKFVETREDSYLFSSLTTQEYHSLLSHSLGLIGNSSSGLIEVPSLLCPTLNIGDRQKGRLHGPSVVDVPTTVEDISLGIQQLKEVKEFTNPYFQEKSSETAYNLIKNALVSGISTKKDFYDIEVEE